MQSGDGSPDVDQNIHSVSLEGECENGGVVRVGANAGSGHRWFRHTDSQSDEPDGGSDTLSSSGDNDDYWASGSSLYIRVHDSVSSRNIHCFGFPHPDD